MKEKQYKIGLMIHDKEMEQFLSHLGDSLSCVLICRYVTFATLEQIVAQFEQINHVDAIVAYSRFATQVRELTSIPVITIPLSEYDFAQALSKAMEKGHHVAYIDMSTLTLSSDQRNYSGIAALVGCEDFRHYICPVSQQYENILKIAIQEGADVILAGSTYAAERTRKHGIPFELLSIGERTIWRALKEALNIAASYESTRQKLEWIETIMEALPIPLISVSFIDSEAPVISWINQAALQTFGIQRTESLNLPVSHFQAHYPAFQSILSAPPADLEEVRISGKSYIVRCDKILDAAHQPAGALYQFQTADDVKKNELELRRNSQKVGFSAKVTFRDIVGKSAAIQNTIDMAIRFSAVTSNILLWGESGSGKEMFAQSIHNASAYANGPFLAINCASLPENLLEAELFGYEAGSFTGASKKGKAGVLELAHHGTLFLDEIAEMTLPLQAKILRVIQERTFRRIGGTQNISIDIRIISATHKDLKEEVEQGNFRADLMYRINTLELVIPSLRQRKEDIPLLAKQFSKTISERLKKPFYLTEPCLKELFAYDWPGNVRELMNIIEQIVVLSMDETAPPEFIRRLLERKVKQHHTTEPDQFAAGSGDTLAVPMDTFDKMEENILRQCYAYYNGNRTKMETKLQISHTTLWRKLKYYQIHEEP